MNQLLKDGLEAVLPIPPLVLLVVDYAVVCSLLGVRCMSDRVVTLSGVGPNTIRAAGFINGPIATATGIRRIDLITGFKNSTEPVAVSIKYTECVRTHDTIKLSEPVIQSIPYRSAGNRSAPVFARSG